MLTLEGVTVAYRARRPVLNDVSVTVEPGRVLAITGPSGAGKTTLLWAMAGLVQPASGRIMVGDEILRNRDQAVAARVVLIPQDNGLATILTAGENVRVALVASGVCPAEARRRAAGSLRRLGIGAESERLVEDLSCGQQQRTAIARGLALRGDVLLADEITSELGAGGRRRVLELLADEAGRGAAVVLATHDPQVAAACDRELHLADGAADLVRG